MHWDVSTYAAFGDMRLRPALELLSRAPIGASASRVVDLGCGAGAVGAALRARFPAARIVGVDPSAEMMDRARLSGAYDALIAGDAAGFAAEGAAAYDLIYANASLHWAEDHAALLPALMARVSRGGAFAAQMPRMLSEPTHRILAEVAADFFDGAPPSGQPGALSPADYAAILEPLVDDIDMWETIYQQRLAPKDGDAAAHPVRSFIEGAAARPFLAALPADRRVDFLKTYDAALEAAYPRRADGSAILPYRRLFIVASRG